MKKHILIFLFGIQWVSAVTIDVVVMYDNSAYDYVGHSGMLTKATNQIDFTNEVFENNQIDIDLRLVHCFHNPDWDEESSESNPLTVAILHTITDDWTYDAFGADLLIFYADDFSWGPLGQTNGIPSSCLWVEYYVWDEIVAHEIGHTLNGRHDRPFDDTETYAHAYHWENTEGTHDYVTIIADGSWGSSSTTRVPFYSTADQHDPGTGHPLGVPAYLWNGEPNPDGAENELAIDAQKGINAARNDPYLFEGSTVGVNGTHSLSWLGDFDLWSWKDYVYTTGQYGRYFEHDDLGWCFVPDSSTVDNLWMYNHTYEAWIFTEDTYYRTAWVDDGQTGWITW